MAETTQPRAAERGVVVDREGDELFVSYGGRYGVAGITACTRREAADKLAGWLRDPANANDVADCIASALFDTADEVERALRVITEQVGDRHPGEALRGDQPNR